MAPARKDLLILEELLNHCHLSLYQQMKIALPTIAAIKLNNFAPTLSYIHSFDHFFDTHVAIEIVHHFYADI